MMSKYLYEFNNPELQQVYQETSENISSRIKELDKISKDIKNLEAYLKNTCSPKTIIECDGIALGWSTEDKRVMFYNPPKNPRPFIECPSEDRWKYAHLLVDLLRQCSLQ